MGQSVIMRSLHFPTMLCALTVCKAVLNMWACWHNLLVQLILLRLTFTKWYTCLYIHSERERDRNLSIFRFYLESLFETHHWHQLFVDVFQLANVLRVSSPRPFTHRYRPKSGSSKSAKLFTLRHPIHDKNCQSRPFNCVLGLNANIMQKNNIYR